MAEEVKKAKPVAGKQPAKASKPEKVAETQKVEKVTKAEAPKAEKVVAKAEKIEKVEKTEKIEKTEKVEKASKAPKRAKVAKVKANILTGRRKDAVARVRLIPGTGKITINNRDMEEYLHLDTLKLIVRQPLKLTDTEGKYDIIVNVYGGGYTGQTGAIRHGIARALVKENENYKKELKKAGFLSRDSRMKERKKYGLHKARKAPQFSKR